MSDPSALNAPGVCIGAAVIMSALLWVMLIYIVISSILFKPPQRRPKSGEFNVRHKMADIEKVT